MASLGVMWMERLEEVRAAAKALTLHGVTENG